MSTGTNLENVSKKPDKSEPKQHFPLKAKQQKYINKTNQ
jgi:hypothetical protein